MFGLLHAHWYVTTRCNSRCATCDIWKKPECRRTPETPVAERLRLLDELRRAGILAIDFTGGEPLLYRDLPELIGRAREMGFMTALTTNGLLYPRHAERLRGKVSLLNFSVDSASPEEHDRIRGVSSFEGVMESIQLARRLGEPVLIKHTATNGNIAGLPGMIALARDLGVMLDVTPEFSYFGNRSLESANLRAVLRAAWSRNVYVNLAHLRFIQEGGNRVDRPKCRVGRAVLVISPDGALYFPCFHLRRTKIPIEFPILDFLRRPDVQAEIGRVGRMDVCRGCSIPCYMDPSYFAELDRFFALSLLAKGIFLARRALLGQRLPFTFTAPSPGRDRESGRE